MGVPQPILQQLTPAAIFLVATIDDGGEHTVHDLLADLSGLRRSVGFRVPGADLTCVTGIGSAAWDRLFTGPRPAELHEFPGYTGPRHQAPATPGDVLFHLKSERHDACFELATVIADRLRGAATIVDETTGFRYFEQRDLMGFVDGTENPEGATVDSAAGHAALVGSEDPDFTGGSYVIVQKYLHQLTDWSALPVSEQERVIGRTKLGDYEFSDADKPPNSHIAVNTLTDPDGTERKILRSNMPFGSVRDGEMGTYFVGYSATPSTTEDMLTRMFLGTDEAAYDRILDFSTAITGTLFFTPTQDFLDDPPDVPELAPAAAAPPNTEYKSPSAPPLASPQTRSSNGSLGIGTLKRSS